MADVTGMRQGAKPRPLGVVKDESMYYDNVPKMYNQSKRRGRQSSFIKGDKNIPNDMKDTLQHAALINIVAAVNERYSGDPASRKIDTAPPGSAIDTLSNTMAVISNLVTPQGRTISIPKPQMCLQLPEELVQKKPVYYKHSENEVRHDGGKQGMFGSYGHSIKIRTANGRPSTSTDYGVKSVIMRAAPGPQLAKKELSLYRAEEKSKWLQQSRSWSPSRSYGAFSKKNEPRLVHEVSKCDAIDIMDTTETFKRSSKVSNDQSTHSASEGHKPQTVDNTSGLSNQYPFYRTKSLPALFPAKRSRSPHGGIRPPLEPKYKPNSKTVHPTEVPPGIYGRNISKSNGRESSQSGDSHKIQFTPPPSRNSMGLQGLRARLSKENSSIETPADSLTAGPRGPRSEKPKLPSDNSEEMKETQMEIVQQRLSSRLSNAESVVSLSDATVDEQSRYASAKSYKSCIASAKPSNGDVNDRRSPKKVKFANSDEVNHLTDEISNLTGTTGPDSDDSHQPVLQHVSTPNQRKGSKSNGTIRTPFQLSRARTDLGPSSSSQPFRVAERSLPSDDIMRLKDKVIPVDTRSRHSANSQQSYELSGDILISRLEGNSAKSSAKSDLSVGGKVKPGADEHEEAEPKQGDWAKTENLNEDLDIVDDDEDSDDGDEENDIDSAGPVTPSKDDMKQEAKYRLVRAVDMQSYSWFEHKKVRKSAQSTFPMKQEFHRAHFVKVKVDDRR